MSGLLLSKLPLSVCQGPPHLQEHQQLQAWTGPTPLCPVWYRQPWAPAEWFRTWDGQRWSSVAETAAWLWCTRSSITRSTLPSHPSVACHSLLPDAMPLVLCSHNAAVSHRPTPTPSLAVPRDWNMLSVVLIHQPSTPSMPRRCYLNDQSVVSALLLTSSCLSCRKRDVPGRCAFILLEKLHFLREKKKNFIGCV